MQEETPTPQQEAAFQAAISPFKPSGTKVQLGRDRVDIEVFEVGELEEADLADMDKHGPEHGVPAVRELRMVHHTVARLMAAGYSNAEIHRITGRNQASLGTLRNSPAFQELLGHYMEKADQRVFSLAERISVVGEEYLHELHNLMDNPQQLTPEFISKTTQVLLDRCGHSPVHKSQNHNITEVLSRDELNDVKERIRENQRGMVVETSFERNGSENTGARLAPGDQAQAATVAQLGAASAGASGGSDLDGESPSQGSEPSGDKSQGQDL